MECELTCTQTLRGRLRLALVPGVTTRELLGWLRDGRAWLDQPNKRVVRNDGPPPYHVEEAVAEVLAEATEATERKWGARP